MNENIKHIAEQSGFTLNQIDDESIKLETFAKLIIKECVNSIHHKHANASPQFHDDPP